MLNKLESLFSNKILILLILLGLMVRFLYFPDNVYFAYDQARDAFISQKIFQGDFKIVGPPASVPGLFHGALSYYILAILYKLFEGNPFSLSAIFRIYNLIGIIPLYIIANKLFGKTTALLSAFIYAVSFEQTQYALFLGHPSLAVGSVLIYYLGLTMLLKEKNKSGLYYSFIGLALSIQFHLSLSILIIQFIPILLFLLRKKVLILKDVFIPSFTFFLIISSYFMAELKFGFQNIKTLTNMFFEGTGNGLYPKNLLLIFYRYINHNFLNANLYITLIILIILMVTLISILKNIKTKISGYILLAWLVFGTIPYIRSISTLTVYYYSIGGSIALIILFSYLIYRITKKTKLGYLIMVPILFSNFNLIKNNNKNGTIPEICVQDKMLLSDELRIIDYMYIESKGGNFSVNALTNPFNVNTTWSYLFEWYGEKLYGRVPVWGGWAAPGYEGNLKVVTSQSSLPSTRFTIFEPRRGIPGNLYEEFKFTENQFWKIEEERSFGDFIVQKRTFFQ